MLPRLLCLQTGALEIVEGKDGAHPKKALTAYSGATHLKSCLEPGSKKTDWRQAVLSIQSFAVVTRSI